MRTIRTSDELRHQVRVARGRGERIALVPARGKLHLGHAALIRVARAQCDLVIAVVIVLEGSASDSRLARDAGADLMWLPPAGSLAADAAVQVVPFDHPDQSALATLDVQILGLAQPDVVYIGERHFDHARLLHQVVHGLCLPIEVRIIATPRTPDGLPVGAADGLHDPAQRGAVAALPRAFDALVARVERGECSIYRLRAVLEAELTGAGTLLDTEEVATVHPETLRAVDRFDGPVLFIARVRVGGHSIVDARLVAPRGD